jgi:transposase-like protein
MEAYSLDLRRRIVAACEQGDQSREEIGEQLGIIAFRKSNVRETPIYGV